MELVLLLAGAVALIASITIYLFTKIIFPRRKRPKLSPNSSKLRNIFVELHNYKFFHSPEGSKKSYNRYVGRAKLREKLKTILENSETRSGAYLVTGFRGMGKTSLVRKAISEIKGNHYYALSRHIRIFLFSLILYLLDSRSGIFSVAIPWLLPLLNIFAIVYLVWHDQNRPNIWKYYKEKYKFPRIAVIRDTLISILSILDPEIDFYKRSKFKTLLQDIFIVTAIYYVFSAIDTPETRLLNKFGLLLALTAIHFLIIYIFNNLVLELAADSKRRRLRSFFRAFRRIFVNAVRRLDFGNKVTIEISLSQDDLKEIDILKLLAKNVYTQYKQLRNRIFAPNRILLPLISFLAIFFSVGSLFYYISGYNRINEFRYNSLIIQLFPSQALLPFDTKKLEEPLPIEGDSSYMNTIQFIEFVNNKLKNRYINDTTDNNRVWVLNSYYEKLNDSLQTDKGSFPKNNIAFQGGQNISTDSLFQIFENPEAAPIASLPQVANFEGGRFRHLTITLDYILQSYYQHAFKNWIDNTVIGKGRHSQDFRLFPFIIDYFFVFWLVLIMFLLFLAERNAWRLGFHNHFHILRRLRFLNENIAAQIVQEQSKSLGISGGTGFRQILNIFNRRSKTYPIAGVREIENELIDILNDIDKIPSISGRPEFIFVFDELDKIEAQYNANIQEKEQEELASFSDEDEGYFSTESIRRRQETIARILGNLKLFFNTARAKFIFIAGREMYDASLADISDRESFISSIFHEIIYVESFFKDQGSYDSTSITSTTEEFVCQLLMPRYSLYPKNLIGYNEYLKDNFSSGKDPFIAFKKWVNKKSIVSPFNIKHDPDEFKKNERRKIIYILEQFITFLTYRGNGAPKKITKLLEGFVSRQNREALKDPNHIVIARNSNNLYLYFDYTCQYRLGLTNYLFKPYLIANTNHMRDFGDKMLIATSFLMDHLYKYHKVGFSWENLELTPEIIAINKSPELRGYISRLIDFMANSHIEEIINGLHQFKFTIRIAAEIKYISTISEVEAAAFNFTLDESLLLKRHYRKKLRSLGKTFSSFLQNANNPSPHIESISLINSILGDLHFYDREYDEALVHYENAGQFVVNKHYDELEITEFIFLIRHLLKVGLTHEKMRAYDSAFIAYGKLTKLIREFGEKYGLAYEKENLRIKRKVFENIRLIFQPLLAQFQITEKGAPNGVTMEDVVRVHDEFQLNINDLESEEKFLIEVEFYNKVADILYYKNGALVYKNISNAEHDKTKKLVDIIVKESGDTGDGLHHIDFDQGVKEHDYKAPLTAYRLYEESLFLFAKRLKELKYGKTLDLNVDQALKQVIDFIGRESTIGQYKMLKSNKKKELLVALGGNLTDMADALMCFWTIDDDIDWVWLEQLFDHSSDQVFGEDRIINALAEQTYSEIKNNITKVIFLSLLANHVFLRAGDYYRCLFQLNKILICIKRVLNYRNRRIDKFSTLSQKHYNIVKKICVEAFHILDRISTHTRQQQVFEWKNFFEIVEGSDHEDEIFRDSLINQPEGREILIILKEIQLYVQGYNAVDLLKTNPVSHSFSIMNNKYNRVFELYYKCTLNFEVFRQIRTNGRVGNGPSGNGTKLLDQLKGGVLGMEKLYDEGIDSEEKLIINLITDSIYCLSEVLRSFNVFGVTYICNHSLNAMVHDHLAFWCSFYQQFREDALTSINCKRFLIDFEDTLGVLIGKIDLQYLDVTYHLKMALQHNYSCLEMHNGGTAYKRAIEEMHYLDDDFDDNLSHFCASEERYRINSGFIRERINNIKEKIASIEGGKIQNIMD